MKPPSADYLPTLDGWRAIAIAMVLFGHLQLPGHAFQSIAAYGPMGVHLFFAISGFLITNRLLEEEGASGRISLRAFYIRRVFRILPAALTYLAVLCLLGFGLALIPLTWGQILSSACFYRNYWVELASQSWYTGHYWSLSVEEHFYLLWPGLLVVMGRRRARWATPLLACLVALWRGLDTQFGWLASLNPAWRDLVGRTDYRMDGLLWGCVAALVWDAKPAREWLRRHARSDYALAAIAAMVLCLILKPPAYLALLAFLMPLPLLATVADPRGWFGRLFETRPMAWFGRLSYSVYIWQMLFLVAYGIPLSLGWMQHLPWNLVLVVLSASASYYLVERPCRRIGRRLARR